MLEKYSVFALCTAGKTLSAAGKPAALEVYIV